MQQQPTCFPKWTKMDNIFYYSTPSQICRPTEHRSSKGTILSICLMETREKERPPNYRKFAYNGNMGVILGTKLRIARSPYQCNYQNTQYSTKSQTNQYLHGGKKKVFNKKDKIISKTAIKYWKKTHKYGMGIPYNVKEAIEIDKENGDKLS